MKKPALAALGVAGACAACCAVPLALPFVSGLIAMGATGWGADALGAHVAVAAGAGAVALLAVGGAAAWWRKRRAARAPSCECAGACATPR